MITGLTHQRCPSGDADGIGGAAHRAVLAAGGQTVAVFTGPVDSLVRRSPNIAPLRQRAVVEAQQPVLESSSTCFHWWCMRRTQMTGSLPDSGAFGFLPV